MHLIPRPHFGFTFVYFIRIRSNQIYGKRMTLILTKQFFFLLDEDVPRSTSNGVYNSQPIRFTRVPGHLADFNARNKVLAA